MLNLNHIIKTGELNKSIVKMKKKKHERKLSGISRNSSSSIKGKSLPPLLKKSDLSNSKSMENGEINNTIEPSSIGGNSNIAIIKENSEYSDDNKKIDPNGYGSLKSKKIK